uniref:HMG box domain-containing protein n=1 Tax=Corethron hystrix TaxID=216773 RepID=A0A7S1FLA7_9STRA|mmetsp:Transcript_10219/g.22670  ORF Transcript_10219/g.22670 Transcript_10219/m.22670 type:complete len:367 (+) Transcript_10219:146-1246(+)
MEEKANAPAAISKEQNPWSIQQCDDGAPRLNKSAYVLYYDSVIDRFAKDNPNMEADELMQLAEESYEALPATERAEWEAKGAADEARYQHEVATYVPPQGYDAQGYLIVPDPEPTPRDGREVTKTEIERAMQTVVARSSVAETDEDPLLEVLFFPRNNLESPRHTEDEGDNFSDWTGLFEYPKPDDEDTVLKYDWMEEHLYDGYRVVLETVLRKGWERMKADFKQIPTAAAWSVQRVQSCEDVEATLMPVLQDGKQVFLLCPTSAECVPRLGALKMPTPYEDRDEKAGAGHYMNHDVWFEDCGDGGMYVLGLDERVLLFYVDGPGDMVYNRWQCHKDQWEDMWRSAFGKTTINIDEAPASTTSTQS